MFRVHPLPKSATYFEVEWPWSSANEAIEAWQEWAPHARAEVTAILHLNAGTHPSISTNGQFLGSSQLVPGLLKSLLDVPGARLATNVEKPYFTLQLLLAGCSQIGAATCHTVGTSPRGQLPRESFNAKSDYIAKPLPPDGRAAMIAATEDPGAGSLLCDAYGGAINRIGPDATAFIHRDPLFCIQYYGAGAATAWIDQASTKMRPHTSGMAYQNYIDPTFQGWQRLLRATLDAPRGHAQPPRSRPLLRLPPGHRSLAVAPPAKAGAAQAPDAKQPPGASAIPRPSETKTVRSGPPAKRNARSRLTNARSPTRSRARTRSRRRKHSSRDASFPRVPRLRLPLTTCSADAQSGAGPKPVGSSFCDCPCAEGHGGGVAPLGTKRKEWLGIEQLVVGCGPRERSPRFHYGQIRLRLANVRRTDPRSPHSG